MSTSHDIARIRSMLPDEGAILRYVRSTYMGQDLDVILTDYLQAHCPMFNWNFADYVEAIGQLDLPEGVEVDQEARSYEDSHRQEMVQSKVVGLRIKVRRDGTPIQRRRSSSFGGRSNRTEPCTPAVLGNLWWVPGRWANLTYQEALIHTSRESLVTKGDKGAGGYRHFERKVDDVGRGLEQLFIDSLKIIDEEIGYALSHDLLSSGTARCCYVGARLRGAERSQTPDRTYGLWG